MIEFGFGFLAGAVVFDQLWRHLRRLEARLAKAIDARSGATGNTDAIGEADESAVPKGFAR